MKSMKKMGVLLGALALMSAGTQQSHGRYIETTPPLSDEDKKRKQDEIKRNKGLKEFLYSNGSVWAINQKTADKKAKKQNLINHNNL